MKSTRIDLTGKTFGRLTVLEYVETIKKDAYWRCRCECGSLKITSSNALRTGHTRSCGCLRKEWCHGYSNTSEYHSWVAMIQRCTNPKDPGYQNYGGRGIQVDPRWMNFRAFIADMGSKPTPYHSISRKDNNGNYVPSNCEWTTTYEQNRNKRGIRYVLIEGQQRLALDVAREHGIHPGTLYSRLEHGWDPVEAVTAPTDLRFSRTAEKTK